jgi:hypothetical protein
MQTKSSARGLPSSRRNKLAASVAALFAISAPVLYANTITVTRCDDQNHIGDLRHGVAGAINDGDIVDMSALACPNSRISLQLGELATSHNITLQGPGRDQLVITGKYYTSPSTFTIQPYRILEHTGTGTLTIKDVTLSDGYATGSVVAGGCIYSKGSVALDHAAVLFCRARTTSSGIAAGGGIFAYGGVSLVYSTLAGNTAYAGVGTSTSAGGGAATNGDFYAFRSTVGGNSAIGVGAPPGSYAGGLFLVGNVMIFASTISGNTAQGPIGGIFLRAYADTTALIGNSTISGNTSLTSGIGGIYTTKAVTTINSSTIAFNTAHLGGSGSFAAGLAAHVPSSSVSSTVNMHSTLIANNTYGTPAVENDQSAVNGTSSTVTIGGSANLVRVSTVSLPVGTITGACPLLGPLRDNGGATLTHALLSHSPGIDQGSNNNLLASDQRGLPYVRQSGAATDIGSYEVQQDDIVFDGGFDGCPAL